MNKWTTTVINSRQQGWGNEVSVLLESESHSYLQEGIDGYNTRVATRYMTVSLHRCVITRLASCD
jgi:hypothetical protein